jgi:hypothetical protein
MKLSKNFTIAELCRTDTGLFNAPNTDQIMNLKVLCEQVLQPLRDYYGAVTINSGFRSPAVNKAVGGASTSQHLRGEAADIVIKDVGNDEIWQYIKRNLPFDQLILEHVRQNNPEGGWVHVSYAMRNRRQSLSCVAKGKYVQGLVYAK